MRLEELQSQGARIVPVAKDNQVVRVVPNADGSLTCTQRSGNEFTIPADMELAQEFVIYSMLNPEVSQ